MTRNLLASSVASIALCFSLPALAQKAAPGVDDSAYITQTGESSGFASQNQPGNYDGNTATITQSYGTGDVATQQQARYNTGVDYAIGGNQTITQSNNYYATASQIDESFYANQTITQYSNSNSSASQAINTPFGSNNTQSAFQLANTGSGITQTIITNTSNTSGTPTSSNSQNASQYGQAGSTITQTIDVDGSNGNSQTAQQGDYYYSPGGNTIGQYITGSSNQQTAYIADVSAYNGIYQNIYGGNSNTQGATISGSSNSNSIYQIVNSGTSNGQSAAISGSSNNNFVAQTV